MHANDSTVRPEEDRPMEMSAEEIKQFWRGFCERRGVGKALVAKGEAKIDEDPEYWADQTMARLLEMVSSQ